MPAPPADAPPPRVIVDVLVPVAVDTAYSYRAPSGAALGPGAFVGVPLGARHATGVVWALREGSGDNLKSVAAIRDWPPLRQPVARLHRLGGALDAQPPRHGAAHGDPGARSH